MSLDGDFFAVEPLTQQFTLPPISQARSALENHVDGPVAPMELGALELIAERPDLRRV